MCVLFSIVLQYPSVLFKWASVTFIVFYSLAVSFLWLQAFQVEVKSLSSMGYSRNRERQLCITLLEHRLNLTFVVETASAYVAQTVLELEIFLPESLNCLVWLAFSFMWRTEVLRHRLPKRPVLKAGFKEFGRSAQKHSSLLHTLDPYIIPKHLLNIEWQLVTVPEYKDNFFKMLVNLQE